MLTENEYCAQLKAETKVLYDEAPEIYSPYFKDTIRFTAEGFHHLQYDSLGHPRSNKAQIRRYKSFIFAPYILQLAGTIQQQRIYKNKEGREIIDSCFIALLPSTPGKNIEVKVIVRKIGNGSLNFCSVMPFKIPDYLLEADPN